MHGGVLSNLICVRSTMKDDLAVAVNTMKTDWNITQHILFCFSINIRLHYTFRCSQGINGVIILSRTIHQERNTGKPSSRKMKSIGPPQRFMAGHYFASIDISYVATWKERSRLENRQIERILHKQLAHVQLSNVNKDWRTLNPEKRRPFDEKLKSQLVEIVQTTTRIMTRYAMAGREVKYSLSHPSACFCKSLAHS